MAPSDRDDQGRQGRARRHARAPGPASEEPRHDAREVDAAQEAFGNAALVELFQGAGGDGAALRALRAARRTGPVTPGHGGDPDTVVDGPLTEEILARGARRRRSREEPEDEAPDALDGDDDDPGRLPDADPAWIDGLEGGPAPSEPPATPEATVQPSTAALLDGLGPWIEALGPWLGASPALRLLLAALAPPAPCLQDPHGRPLLARARAAAAAVSLACESGLPPELARAIAEIAAARPLADRLERHAAASDELPSALALAGPHLLESTLGAPRGASWTGGQGEAAEPSPALRDALARLVALPRATALVPRSAPAPADDDDDPLGLDRFLDTRPERPDPDADARRACVEAADRMAGRVSALGARLAAAAVARLRAAPAFGLDLIGLLRSVDDESRRILHLLLDVADTAREDPIPVKGLRNGLRHAARAIDDLHDRTLDALARVDAPCAAPPDREPDPLDLALQERRPEAARPWLEASAPGWDREVALALLDALAPAPPDVVLTRLDAAAARVDRPRVRAALDQLVGGALLWVGRAEDALALARRGFERARQREDGALAASCALLEMEAHLQLDRPGAAETARDEGGRLLLALGSPALTLLARWRPPDPDPDPEADAEPDA